MKYVVMALIRFYQTVISPATPPRCRFIPSCSEYSLEAVSQYGVLVGGWMSLRRLLKCGPWHPGGFDPVPTKKSSVD